MLQKIRNLFSLRRILHGIRWRRQYIAEKSQLPLAQLSVLLRWYFSFGSAPRHELPAQLVVSLTSYPPRFGTLLPTIRCLLRQSVRPDRLILWVGQDDYAVLPTNIRALEKSGLEIRVTRDLRSYKKIIPALNEFPEAFIVTADDDIYYRSNWLEGLLTAWDGRRNLVVCHRAHELPDGDFDVPYDKWHWAVQERKESLHLFPTGVGGVFYPPGVLSPAVLDEAQFQKICPYADDIWLYWMGRLAGATYMTTGDTDPVICWPGSQEVGLYADNLSRGRNDEQIRSMIATFGIP